MATPRGAQWLSDGGGGQQLNPEWAEDYENEKQNYRTTGKAAGWTGFNELGLVGSSPASPQASINPYIAYTGPQNGTTYGSGGIKSNTTTYGEGTDSSLQKALNGLKGIKSKPQAKAPILQDSIESGPKKAQNPAVEGLSLITDHMKRY